MKRWFLRGAILAVLFLSFFIVYNFRELTRFPKIVSAYYAKEFCSCVYVSELPEEFCHGRTETYIPISGFEWSQAEKTIRVRGLGRRSAAQYFDRMGCQIVE